MKKILTDDYADDFDSDAWLNSIDDDIDVLAEMEGEGDVGYWNDHGEIKGFFDLYEDVSIYAEPTTIEANANYERESGELNGVRRAQKREARMRHYYANHEKQKAEKRKYNRERYYENLTDSREQNKRRVAEWRARKKLENK